MKDEMRPLDTAWAELCAWWRSLTHGEKERWLDGFAVEFAYNSGKIENDDITLHDTREIFDNGRLISFTGNLRTVFEMRNQKVAWSHARAAAEAGAPFGTDELLELHRLLTQGTYDERRWAQRERPGSFKRGDYVVAGDVGFPPEEVPGAVAALLADLEDFLALGGLSARKALVASCYAHAKLADVHPFADGNGRTARLFQNIVLLRCGLPPITVHEADRMAYFGALDAFHADGALGPFIDFCMAEAVKTWNSSMSR